MIRYVYLILLAIVILLATSLEVKAIEIVENNVPGERFTMHNRIFKGSTGKFVTGELIDEQVLEDNIRTVDRILKDLSFMDKYNFEVIMSTHSIKKINAFKYYNKGERKYYIVIARESRKFKDIASTLIHELGHIFQESNNINLNWYNSIVYKAKRTNKRTTWKYLLREEFAEDFKMAIINKYYKGTKVKKNTYRNYNNRFYKIYWRYFR